MTSSPWQTDKRLVDRAARRRRRHRAPTKIQLELRATHMRACDKRPYAPSNALATSKLPGEPVVRRSSAEQMACHGGRREKATSSGQRTYALAPSKKSQLRRRSDCLYMGSGTADERKSLQSPIKMKVINSYKVTPPGGRTFSACVMAAQAFPSCQTPMAHGSLSIVSRRLI